MQTRPIILFSCFLFCAPAWAQAPAYNTSPGDSMSYREVTETTIRLQTPQGNIAVQSAHDATITLRFIESGLAHASYTALTLNMDMQGQSTSPDTDSILDVPYVLTFPANGRIETNETPDFPESIREITDLTQQFDDFFLVLPDALLTTGYAWTDSTSTETETIQRHIKTGQYEVVGDSVVVGIPVKVIAATLTSVITTTEDGPAPGMTTTSELSGTEEGFFFFSPENGLFVGRIRTGLMTGEIRYEGGPQTMRLPQEMRYKSSIELLHATQAK